MIYLVRDHSFFSQLQGKWIMHFIHQNTRDPKKNIIVGVGSDEKVDPVQQNYCMFA